MKRWMNWLISPTVLGTLGLLVLSALVWWVGPLLAVGNWRPLDGVGWRLLVIGLLWLAWIGQRVWRHVRQGRANKALVTMIGVAESTSVPESTVDTKLRFVAAPVVVSVAVSPSLPFCQLLETLSGTALVLLMVQATAGCARSSEAVKVRSAPLMVTLAPTGAPR